VPEISLIIPTRRRWDQLWLCLASLAEQTYTRTEWEVIVVIDGDDDVPEQTIARWGDRLPLRVVRQIHAGCGMARNNGSGYARGRFLVFTDDDCQFPPYWLSEYAKHFQATPDCLIAGRPVNALPQNPYSQATQEVIDQLLAQLNVCSENAVLAIGNNFGVPAEDFRALEGFSACYCRVAGAEDRDFAWRWRARGKRIVYASDIIVRHSHDLTLASFLRQHFHYGRGARIFYGRACPEIDRPKSAGLSFYKSLLLRPWVERNGFSAERQFVLLLASQAAHLVGFLAPRRAALKPFRPSIVEIDQ
jgi:glycosyltransferase involved in cell wall biosynthesis